MVRVRSDPPQEHRPGPRFDGPRVYVSVLTACASPGSPACMQTHSLRCPARLQVQAQVLLCRELASGVWVKRD